MTWWREATHQNRDYANAPDWPALKHINEPLIGEARHRGFRTEPGLNAYTALDGRLFQVWAIGFDAGVIEFFPKDAPKGLFYWEFTSVDDTVHQRDELLLRFDVYVVESML